MAMKTVPTPARLLVDRRSSPYSIGHGMLPLGVCVKIRNCNRNSNQPIMQNISIKIGIHEGEYNCSAKKLDMSSGTGRKTKWRRQPWGSKKWSKGKSQIHHFNPFHCGVEFSHSTRRLQCRQECWSPYAWTWCRMQLVNCNECIRTQRTATNSESNFPQPTTIGQQNCYSQWWSFWLLFHEGSKGLTRLHLQAY